MEYIPVLVLVIVSTVIAGAMVGLSFLLGPKKPSAYKSTSYECGMVPVGNARERFPIKFYLIAMLFIVFDIETVFLYPWAVTFAKQGFNNKVFFFGEMVVFVVILFVGYFYILGKGALEWDESERAGEGDIITPEMKRQRPAIRFGNENSGDVKRMPAPGRTPSYGASSQEERILTAPTGE